VDTSGGRQRRTVEATRNALLAGRDLGMDGVREFLNDLKGQGHAVGNLLGVLNVLIGRHITRPNGTLVSNGLTWRMAAAWLKKVRWDRETVRELGLDPAQLPPRDRERFWYTAIARAGVDSPQAMEAGNRLAEALREKGYLIGPAPQHPGK
jgi:hypothetical protein